MNVNPTHLFPATSRLRPCPQSSLFYPPQDHVPSNLFSPVLYQDSKQLSLNNFHHTYLQASHLTLTHISLPKGLLDASLKTSQPAIMAGRCRTFIKAVAGTLGIAATPFVAQQLDPAIMDHIEDFITEQVTRVTREKIPSFMPEIPFIPTATVKVDSMLDSN